MQLQDNVAIGSDREVRVKAVCMYTRVRVCLIGMGWFGLLGWESVVVVVVVVVGRCSCCRCRCRDRVNTPTK